MIVGDHWMLVLPPFARCHLQSSLLHFLRCTVYNLDLPAVDVLPEPQVKYFWIVGRLSSAWLVAIWIPDEVEHISGFFPTACQFDNNLLISLGMVDLEAAQQVPFRLRGWLHPAEARDTDAIQIVVVEDCVCWPRHTCQMSRGLLSSLRNIVLGLLPLHILIKEEFRRLSFVFVGKHVQSICLSTPDTPHRTASQSRTSQL